MAFVVAHRFTDAIRLRGGSATRAVQRLKNVLVVRQGWTPQQRANAYVSRMPIAVITASMGGHPPLSAGHDR